MELNIEEFGFLDRQFKLPGAITKVASLGSGHIHDTFLITCADQRCSRFVMQKFNQNVFKKPLEVMSNIDMVLEHINNTGANSSLLPLRIIKTHNNELIHLDKTGNYYRLYNYIGHSDSFDKVTNPEQARGGAKAFGQFFELLNDLDPKDLYTTIPDFHNLKARFAQLQAAVTSDPVKRVDQYQEEVSFALERESQVIEYSKLLKDPKIPFRVTHNDTKINNVLFDKGTTRGKCVVDLDTIMPGLLLFDFGDMGRTFCNAVLEEGKADQATFRLNIFEAVCDGFFSCINTPLGKIEIDSLKVGPWWLTYIMAIRFLADFLLGDVYYKIGYPLQNLDRARNQLNLTADIERKQQEINAIIDTTIERYVHS